MCTLGLTPRGSLEKVLLKTDLFHLIDLARHFYQCMNEHCLDKTLFRLDEWRAYDLLPGHLDLENVLHYPVNHSAFKKQNNAVENLFLTFGFGQSKTYKTIQPRGKHFCPIGMGKNEFHYSHQ